MARRFAVMHNYGSEGWQFVDKARVCDSVWSAVEARENDIRSSGGEVMIVEVIDVLDAYALAAREREEMVVR